MENPEYTVLINGMGNIGTTLANLLVRHKDALCITKIYLCKRTLTPWNFADRNRLAEQGVIICTETPSDDLPLLAEVLPQVDYIFEATANGVGLSKLSVYNALPRLKGACAQGSEKGFGLSFMTGINNEVIRHQKFVHVVSCNTHGTAALLKTFCGNNLENLAEADMVVVRRSEDLGNHQRLVAANVVARHLSQTEGTHHAIDVVDLFKTKGVTCRLTSSDITTPSQLMHSVRFNITLKEPLEQSVSSLLKANPFMAQTAKFDSNVVFEQGRRYGFNGRLFSHAIVVSGNVLTTEKGIKGWAFVPQEGNSILSTLHAYLLQMNIPDEAAVFETIKATYLASEW